MPTSHQDTGRFMDDLLALLDAGETLAETVRTYVARSTRSQMLGRHAMVTRGDECLLQDAVDVWCECAGSMELNLASIATTLSSSQWPARR